MSTVDAKRQRLLKALRHEEGDRVPISDFFWSSFVYGRYPLE
jgi:hypothetical protein